MKPKFVKITVTIREDQKALLDKHPEVNVSGLFQKAIDDWKKKVKAES